MQRRSFLAGIFAGAAAPAIVRASSLMKIWVPPQEVLTLDGPEWFYANRQGEDIAAVMSKAQQAIDELCGIRPWSLVANDPMQQARADRMEAMMRAEMRGSGLSILTAAQQRLDRELRREQSAMLRRVYEELLLK